MQQNDLIRSLMQCAIECENCANACLDEGDKLPMMVNCIRLDRDCASMCRATAELLVRGSDMTDKLVEICADMCHRCAEECERHNMDHCRECARACRECEEACRSYAAHV